MNKYKTTVTAIGELAEELLQQQGMMVLFDNTAPMQNFKKYLLSILVESLQGEVR
jgi:sorbitol-specific phosphotransferase system component IIA